MTIWLAVLLAAALTLPFATRMAGGGFGVVGVRNKITARYGEFWGSAFGHAPEFYVACVFGLFNFALFSSWWLALLAVVITFCVQEYLGQGTTQNMNGYSVQPGDEGRLDGTDIWVRKIYKGDVTRKRYSWYTVGLKGFLLGLGIFPFGLPLTILHPTSYWLGNRVEQEHAVAEIMWGYFSMILGLCIIAYLCIYRY